MNDTKSLRKLLFTVAPWLIAAISLYSLYQDRQRRALWKKIEEERAIAAQAVIELGKLGAVFKNPRPPDFRVKVLKFVSIGERIDGRWVVNKSTLTDDDMKHLAALTTLEEVQLTATGFTDAGMAHLQGLTKLKSLSISNPEITDEGLDYLKGLTNLERFQLFGTKVTDKGVEELQKSLPDCEITFTGKRNPPESDGS